jgi:hypothetical protein
VRQEAQEWRAVCNVERDGVGRSVSRCGLTALPYGHHASTCASTASVCGNQKVISVACYIAIAVDSSARDRSRWPVLA